MCPKVIKTQNYHIKNHIIVPITDRCILVVEAMTKNGQIVLTKRKVVKVQIGLIFFKSWFHVRSVYSCTIFLKTTKIQSVFSFWPFSKKNTQHKLCLELFHGQFIYVFFFEEMNRRKIRFEFWRPLSFMHTMYDFYKEAKQIRMQGGPKNRM